MLDKLTKIIKGLRPEALTPGTTAYRMRDVRKTIAACDRRVNLKNANRPPVDPDDFTVVGDASVHPNIFRQHFGDDTTD